MYIYIYIRRSIYVCVYICIYACMYKEGDRGLRADMKVMAAK